MKYFLAIAIPLLFVNLSIAQKVKPALHLTNGQTYYMVSNANSAIVQTVNGQDNALNLSFTFKMAFKVTGIIDTLYKMEVSYEALDMKIQLSGQTIEMDSKKNDPNDIPSSIMAAMMNKPFNITLTRSGKIKSIENVEKMIAGAFDSFSKIDSAKKQQLKTQFMQSFGENAFKGSLEMGTAIFPDKPVAKMDKWVVNTSLESPAKANVNITYQLTDVTPAYYQIHGEGTMVTDKNGKPALINGMAMKYDLNGTLTSDIKADKKTGWISEVKLKQVMKGNIEIPDNPKVPGGMTIPMTFNTDITTTDK